MKGKTVSLLEEQKTSSILRISQETKSRLDQLQEELKSSTQDELLSVIIDAYVVFQQILAVETKEVEPGQRVYTSSPAYGNSRYHILEKRYDGLQIEQVDVEEKWNKRVNLYGDEKPALLKMLLIWHMEEARQQQETVMVAPPDDGLPTLDDHPF
jgi:predicted DNA-binding protein